MLASRRMGLADEIAKGDARRAAAVLQEADRAAKFRAEQPTFAALAEAVQLLTQHGVPTLPVFVRGSLGMQFTGHRGWYFPNHDKALIDARIFRVSQLPPRGEYKNHGTNGVGLLTRHKLGLGKFSPVLTIWGNTMFGTNAEACTTVWLAMVVGNAIAAAK